MLHYLWTFVERFSINSPTVKLMKTLFQLEEFKLNLANSLLICGFESEDEFSSPKMIFQRLSGLSPLADYRKPSISTNQQAPLNAMLSAECLVETDRHCK